MTQRRLGAVGDYLDMMASALVVANPSTAARGFDGSIGYSTRGSTYRARVTDADAKSRKVPGFDGTVTSVAWIASTSTSAITMKSKITMPDGATPPIAMVNYVRDERGVHHTKVWFG